MAAKFVLNRSIYSSSTEGLRSLHCMSTQQRIKFKVLTLVYKSLKGQTLVYLQNLLVPLESGRNLHSSSDMTRFLIPKTKAKMFVDRSFSVGETSYQMG